MPWTRQQQVELQWCQQATQGDSSPCRAMSRQPAQHMQLKEETTAKSGIFIGIECALARSIADNPVVQSSWPKAISADNSMGAYKLAATQTIGCVLKCAPHALHSGGAEPNLCTLAREISLRQQAGSALRLCTLKGFG